MYCEELPKEIRDVMIDLGLKPEINVYEKEVTGGCRTMLN